MTPSSLTNQPIPRSACLPYEVEAVLPSHPSQQQIPGEKPRYDWPGTSHWLTSSSVKPPHHCLSRIHFYSISFVCFFFSRFVNTAIFSSHFRKRNMNLEFWFLPFTVVRDNYKVLTASSTDPESPSEESTEGPSWGGSEGTGGGPSPYQVLGPDSLPRAPTRPGYKSSQIWVNGLLGQWAGRGRSLPSYVAGLPWAAAGRIPKLRTRR